MRGAADRHCAVDPGAGLFRRGGHPRRRAHDVLTPECRAGSTRGARVDLKDRSGPTPRVARPFEVLMPSIARRTLLRNAGLLGAGMAMTSLFPAWARSNSGGLVRDLPMLSGADIKLRIGHTAWPIDGRHGHAVTINGTVPGPIIRLKEGQIARIAVTNTLDEDTSIHWHGLLVPFQMDGVPGVSFPGIRAGRDLRLRVPGRASPGPTGTTVTRACRSCDGPLRADRHRAVRDADPVAYDREHVVVLGGLVLRAPARNRLDRKLKQQARRASHRRRHHRRRAARRAPTG
jgi:hypothetical protein